MKNQSKKKIAVATISVPFQQLDLKRSKSSQG